MNSETLSDVPLSRQQSSDSLPRAGFWIRVVAGLLDLFLLVVPFCVFVSFAAAVVGISNPFFNNRIGKP